jgi:hypothetical protein
LNSISERFFRHGCQTLDQAISFVHALPYGRNTDRADYRLVLSEGKGTCSTKHALIAAFAEEQQHPVSLCTGLFEMNAQNTPQIANILKKYKLESVLEAHCYLLYNNVRIDITFPDKITYPKGSDFLQEFMIKPHQISEHKLALHRQHMENWIKKNNIAYELEYMWKIREECIAAIEVITY